MAIGNPISLTSNVASKTINVIATASQTLFTVTGGYRLNELSVFRNGVRLVDGRDFTARDGSIVTLLSAASEGDVLEFQVFDTFRVADAITPFDSAQTIAGDLSIVGVLSATQLGSVNFNLTSGIQTFHDVRVGGALTVAGSLTYEDTTNTNTVGLATFSGGMNISGVGATVTTLNVTGVSTFASNVSIADSIFHTGDPNTSFGFPAADTFTIDTGGGERFRITSSGNIGLDGTTSPRAKVDFGAGSGDGTLSQTLSDYQAVFEAPQNTGDISRNLAFAVTTGGICAAINAVDGGGSNATGLIVATGTAGAITEKLRITSAGLVGIGTNNPSGAVHVYAASGTQRSYFEAAAAHSFLRLKSASTSYNSGVEFFSGASNIATINGLGAGGLQFEVNGSERLRITSDGKVRVPDGGMFTAGAGDDLQINHDSSNTFIDNYTGTFVLRNYADDSDILLSSDDSSGGTADYVRCDGSEGSVILSHYGSTKLETSATGVTVTGTLNATTALTQNGNALATNGKAIAMALIFG